MGNPISMVKEAAAKVSAEDEKEANDVLNSLMEIAKKNLELFEVEIRSDTDKHLLPIDKIIISDHVIQCSVSKNADNIKNAVSSTIKNFASGNFVNGITNVVDAGLDILLGNYSGNVSERKSYVVSVGTLGGFYRIDYYMYSYAYTSKSLVSITKNVVCVAYVVSSIKTESLNPNTVRVILQTTFGSLGEDHLQSLQANVFKALGYDKKEHVNFRSHNESEDEYNKRSYYKGKYDTRYRKNGQRLRGSMDDNDGDQKEDGHY
eukprot:376022_1